MRRYLARRRLRRRVGVACWRCLLLTLGGQGHTFFLPAPHSHALMDAVRALAHAQNFTGRES